VTFKLCPLRSSRKDRKSLTVLFDVQIVCGLLLQQIMPMMRPKLYHCTVVT